MWKKRGTALLLALAVWAGLVGVAGAEGAAVFPDVPEDYWAYGSIERFVRRGVIDGKPGGTFAPEEEVTREQFAKMMALAFYLPLPQVTEAPFADVPADSWAAPYTAACKAYINTEAHINTQTERATLVRHFRPQDPATREEVAAALLRVMGLEEYDGADLEYAKTKFSDADAIDPAMLSYVSLATQLGLVTGYPDGTFGPQRGVSRAEAAVLLERALSWNGAGETGVALQVGDHDLSVADMDYYYWNAVNDAALQEQFAAQLYALYGLEYTPQFDVLQDLRTQYVDGDGGQSYHDYFLDLAKKNAVQVFALSDAALAAGYTLSPEGQADWDDLKAEMSENAKTYGFSRLGHLEAIYGPDMTVDTYFRNVGRAVLATDYSDAVTADLAACTDGELEAYYAAHPDGLDSYDYTYAYFDGWAQEDGDAALARARGNAEALLAGVKEGGDFSALAKEQGADAAPRIGVMDSLIFQMPYAGWLADPARQDGDTELFELEDQGFYVVQFHKRYLDNGPTVDARHILLQTTAEDGPATEEYINQVKAQAQAILDEFNAGEKTAEAFGALADEHSEDGRDEDGNLYAPGGLYEKIAKGQMIQPFEDWCFDPARKAGDTGLVQTEYGWHVMYFQGYNRPAWMDQAAEDLLAERTEDFVDKAQAGHDPQEGPAWGQVGLER